MTVTESVALIRFPQASHAYQGLSELRQLDADLTSLDIRSAALLERRPDGTLHMPELGDVSIGAGTATGGLIGMLVGVLGGPLGLLLGFGTGTLVGGVFDIDRATKVDGTLALLSREIPPGTTVLILEAAETTPEPLDQLAARFDATVERQPTSEVTAEIEAAAAAAGAAQKEANRVLRERKRAELRAKLDEHINTAKQKLNIG
ncbi:hypothetical protein DLE60_21080 [Micromonospora globispora]|uniref:DUF1269 domain-containing protein n=1 Tax=Micromonospora globispora TaxID=1450148 RepID=A0A317K223_9ACTN|nr:DUF1269 domain-containing protein [Micromonospora globispora]PWU46344.1 hypothetical protein DLJ46_18475 [Micromonospora globispora]PWU58572.1 hypothetical protein DLE60_21080 [Micromonospora globispora]RQW87753.1 hypothetical protein DKL51_25670 [Micromonospora globispora]